MHRTHLALALAVLFAVAATGLTACGGSSSSPTTPTPDPTVVNGTASGAGGTALDKYVKVTYTPQGGGTPSVFNTNDSGVYSANVAPGMYDVKAERPGYTDFTQTGVDVTANTASTLDLPLVPLGANVYIGSESCGVCHSGHYDTFTRTGHPYKLNKVNGAAPSYPYTSLAGVDAMIADDGVDMMTDPNGTDTDNTLGTPSGWAQMTYVIGGFYWKARFLDMDGYIVTGTSVQYNFDPDGFGTQGMSAYHNNQTDVPYNCGNCHTTGWKHWDAGVSDVRQDGLPGMDGSFAAPGVHCEACHGAGSTHAQTKSMADITETATPRTLADFQDGMFAYGKPVACGECHTRDGERDHPTFQSAYNVARLAASKSEVAMGGRIAASGGATPLIKHHEQYDEILGVDPDTLESVRSAGFMSTHGDCLTCHTSHTSTVYRDQTGDTSGVKGDNAFCMGCHPAKDPNLRTGGMKTLNCVDCHMPLLAKSATSKTLGNGVVVGDVTSHIFRIRLNKTATPQSQFTPAGTFAYPHLIETWACNICHGNSAFALSQAAIDGFTFHNN